MAIRPILTTGVALASAGAIVAASPVVLPAEKTATASVPAPLAAPKTLSVDQVRLLALSDITWTKIVEVFQDGYGGWVDDLDPYYPTDDPAFPDGFAGVAYYLSDQFLDSVILTGLPLLSDLAEFVYYYGSPYAFEVNLFAAFHVMLAEATGGPGTPFAQLLQLIFNPGGGMTMLAALEAMPDPPSLADLTLPALVDVFTDGYGNYIGPGDEYYPQDPVLVNGFPGLLYYVGDAALQSVYEAGIPLLSDAAVFVRDKLTSYAFEVSSLAAFHVALAEAAGGRHSPVGELLQLIFNPDAVQVPEAAPQPEMSYEAEPSVGANDVTGPEVPPKNKQTLVDVSLSGSEDVTEDVTDENVDVDGPADDGQGADAAEPVQVKRPKLNVKRKSPIAGTLADLKENVDKTRKSVRDGLEELAGGLGKSDEQSDDTGAEPGSDSGDGGKGGDDSGE